MQEIVFYINGNGSYIVMKIKLNGTYVREDIFALPPNYSCYNSIREICCIIEERVSPTLVFHPTIEQ
jgi:hypothetical protein